MGGFSTQEKHVVLDMLKVLRGHGQEGSSHRRIAIDGDLQAKASNKANSGVDDGFGCEPMEVAILEAEDITRKVKRADLTATVR